MQLLKIYFRTISAGCLATALIACSAALYAQTPASPAPVPKKPIRGLTSMGITGFNSSGGQKPVVNDQAELFAHPGVYKGSVINVTWRDLEPKQGEFDFKTIEAGLKALRKYNAANPKTPAVAKLRVWSGPNVPAWVFAISGGPYPVTGKKGDVDIAGYWTPEYIKAWRGLQAALAAKYDADPLVGEVGSSSCSAVTDESFILPKGDKSQKKMREHGFNDAAEQSCLLGMVDDYAAWKLTPVDQTFSPYVLTDGGKAVRDLDFNLKVMHVWRDHFGERGVLSNHSVQDPLTENLQPIFDQLKSMGQPMELQTASQGVIQHGKEVNGQAGEGRDPRLPPLMDWNNVIRNAIDIGANEIEIWNTVDGGGQTKISYAQLKAWSQELK